jgi:hypothetical protein
VITSVCLSKVVRRDCERRGVCAGCNFVARSVLPFHRAHVPTFRLNQYLVAFMVRVRCLSAVQDLLLQSSVLQQTQQLHGALEGSLLQRLHSSLFITLAGALPAAAAAIQCSNSGTLPAWQQHPQQQQQQLQHPPSCWHQSRSYARAFRSGQRGDRGDARQDRYQPQQQQQQQRVELPQLQLGRQLGNCVPTEAMRQPDEDDEARGDPFRERDPLLINPRQVRC